MAVAQRHFAVVPAAGVGSRMGSDRPKQYLEIGDRSILEWSVAALADAPWIEAVIVVVAAGDGRAARLLGGWPRVQVIAEGGATRSATVLAGVRAVMARGGADCWVLVHDAARPGLARDSLEALRLALTEADSSGAILAWPVADTVKRALPSEVGMLRVVQETVPREGLWLAQTPQAFRAGELAEALTRNPAVTDESAAMEALGVRPVLVPAPMGNFKVTTPADLDEMRRRLVGSGRPAMSRPAGNRTK